MKQIIADGLVTSYQTLGEGSVVLFLHGWGSDMTIFKDLAEKLQKTHKVILLDLPGFGKTEAPKETWGLDGYAAFISSFLYKINANPEVVIAHSNGAAIAIKGIASGVFSSDKLVVLGGAGVRNAKQGRKRLLKVVAMMGKPLLSVLPKAFATRLRKKWYGAIGSEMMLVPGMEETFKKTVAEDVLHLSQNVTAKTLLIYGEDDEATPPELGRLFNDAMPNSELKIVANAGHYVFLDKPEQVAKFIVEFLA